MSDNYGSVQFIRDVTDVPVEEVSDSELVQFRDRVALPKVNDDIMRTHRYERVEYVSEEKRNRVDGESKTFYLPGLHNNGRFLGDLTDTGEVAGEDVEMHLEKAGETYGPDNFSVNVVDDFRGVVEVEMAEAIDFEDEDDVQVGDPVPNGELYFARYVTSPVRVGDGGDQLGSADIELKNAASYLTAYYAYSKIEAPKLEDYSLDNISISEQSKAEEYMKDLYDEKREKLVQRDVVRSGQNNQKPDGSVRRVMRDRRTRSGLNR